MSLVQVKAKSQITIPAKIRELLGIKEGDYLEAEVKRDSIILTPKEIIDKKKEKAREKIFALLEKNWQRNKNVPYKEIEAVVNKAVQKVKEEEIREIKARE